MALDQQNQIRLPFKKKQVQNEFLQQIMIVDDDYELLEELKDYLSFNYEVKTLFDSSHAFEIACELKPDLIIIDMKMSPKTGFQLANELRKSPETKLIPIIAITGVYVEKEHELMMRLLGVDRIIIKPFDPDRFLEEIRGALKIGKPRWFDGTY